MIVLKGPSDNFEAILERKLHSRIHRGLPATMARYFRLIFKNLTLSKTRSYEVARYGSLAELHPNNTLERVYASAGSYVESAFFGGSKRVIGRNGKTLKLNPITNKWAVDYLQRNQFRYLKRLVQYQQNKIGDILQQGAVEGESIPTIAKKIEMTVGTITRHRANTISRGEMIHSHSLGLLQTMKENEIEHYKWMANYNPGVGKNREPCHICKALHKKVFRTDLPIWGSSFKGKTKSAVNAEISNLRGNYAFLPAKSTHPHCRCAIIADVFG